MRWIDQVSGVNACHEYRNKTSITCATQYKRAIYIRLSNYRYFFRTDFNSVEEATCFRRGLVMHVSSQSFFITSYSVPFWSRAISYPSLPRPQHHKKTLQAVIHFSVWFILEYQEKIRRTRNTCSKYLEDLNMRANETRIYFWVPWSEQSLSTTQQWREQEWFGDLSSHVNTM